MTRSPSIPVSWKLPALFCLLATGPLLAAGVLQHKSGPAQISADGVWLWIADAETDRVYRIDTRDDSVFEIDLDPVRTDRPLGLSVMEDGSELWVTAHDTDRLHVIDGPTGAVTDTIALPFGAGPYSVALSPPDPSSGRQERALVTLHRAEALAVVDTSSHEVTVLEPVFTTPYGIVWTDAGDEAWVTHLMVIGEHPKLTRVDTSGGTPRVTTRLETGRANPITTGNFPTEIPEGGYLNWRGHPAQIPGSLTGGLQEVWIPTQYSNMNGNQPSVDSTVQSSLRKLDLTTRTVSPTDKVVLTAVDVHDPQGSNAWQGYGWDAQVAGPVDIGFAEVGGNLYAVALHENSNDVVILPANAAPWKSQSNPGAPGLPEISVGDRPMGMVLSPAADVAYVYNSLSSDISVLDLAARTETRRIPFPTQVDPLDPLVMGARLFHTSDDPRISVNQKVACASCHLNAEHDGRTWAFEHLPAGTAGQGHGPRSTITLRDLSATHTPGQRDAVYGWGQLHHSGDRDEIQDFEHTFIGIQMGGTGFIPSGRDPELSGSNMGKSADLDAIAAYLMSLEPLQRSPHRDSAGNLTEAALRGATFFTGTDPANFPADADCASCHIPESSFVDHAFHDVGQRRANGENELNNRSPAWHVNTLTLVGMWNTPPYDGVLRFAEQFIPALLDFRDQSYGRTTTHGSHANLTGRQIADLAEFLLSIDGAMASDPAEVRGARDTAPPRIVRVEPAGLTRFAVWFDETVDPASAGTPQSWMATRTDTGDTFFPVAAQRDARNGDRVDLTFDPPLPNSCAGVPYTLQPVGDIYDVADRASVHQGPPNALDPGDPANTHAFVLGDRLTVTMGASGNETIPITVHDASPVGPGLSTWAHDRVQPSHLGGNRVPGFLRFEWRDALVQAAALPGWSPGATDILDARFSLEGEAGDAQEIELRRVLQRWSDPNDCDILGSSLTNSPVCGDWNQNPVGAPTWRDHEHPSGRWVQPGAGALGGTGGNPADYGTSQWDLAGVVDARISMQTINERTTFADPNITDAFRFWFDNPSIDYGYALRVTNTPPYNPVVRFHRWEDDLFEHGPVLEITYRIPVPPVPEVSGSGAPARLSVRKQRSDPDDLELYFEDLGGYATSYNLYAGDLAAPFDAHTSQGCHLVPAAAGGLRNQPHTARSGSRYFLVTGSDPCMEGTAGFASSGAERDPLRLSCGSD